MILLFVPVLAVIELFFGATGTWWSLGGFDVRMVLFIGTFICLVLLVLLDSMRQRGYWLLSDWLPGTFLIMNLPWLTLIPLLNGVSIGQSFDEANALLVLVLFYPCIYLLRSHRLAWGKIKAMTGLLGALFAFLHVVIWVVGSLFDKSNSIGANLQAIYRIQSGIYVGIMPDGFYRVFFVTSLLLVPTFFGFLHGVLEQSDRRKLNTCCLVLVTAAIIVTYTRSCWIAVLCGAALTIALRARRSGRLRRMMVLSALAMVVLAVGFWMLDVLGSQNISVALSHNEILKRLASVVNSLDSGNKTRLEETTRLLATWRTSPVFGHGYGSSIPGYYASSVKNFSYEATAPALLMKTGLVGLALWVAFMVGIVQRARRKFAADEAGRVWYAYWLGGFVAFVLAVQTNPLLFNNVGMAILLFFMIDATMIDRPSHSPQLP